MMRCRGVRGATTASANTRAAILSATRELLGRLVDRNAIQMGDIASAFFTVSDDLDAEYPALAARQMGWHEVALLCAREIPVPGALERCIRVLLHINTDLAPGAIRHVYLREAVALRPSRADAGETSETSETSETGDARERAERDALAALAALASETDPEMDLETDPEGDPK